MQSLLSPAESQAFQSFLSAIDYVDDNGLTSSEWALYNAPLPSLPTDDPLLESMHNHEGREALAKATKDLMSLDTDAWGNVQRHPGPQHVAGYDLSLHPMAHFAQQSGMHPTQQQQQQQQQQQLTHTHDRSQALAQYSHDPFPFLHAKQQHGQNHFQGHLQYPLHSLQIPQTQHHHPTNHHSLSPLGSAVNGDHPHSPASGTPSTPHSPFGFTAHGQQQPQQQQHMPPGMVGHRQPQPQHPVHLQHRPARTSSMANPSSSRSNGTSASSRRTRQSSTASSATSALSPSSSTDSGSATTHTAHHPKQTLLSPSQKKANHIMSEQKRRANIRRGYEALCETVPALRDAIREEEEQERLVASGLIPSMKGKKRSKKREADEKDSKTDGRAGPRSENVVLSKTIDYIEVLLSERSDLLTRLHRARSALPPGHPCLQPLIPDPPWEKEWKGGEGRLGDEDPEGSGEEDGE